MRRMIRRTTFTHREPNRNSKWNILKCRLAEMTDKDMQSKDGAMQDYKTKAKELEDHNKTYINEVLINTNERLQSLNIKLDKECRTLRESIHELAVSASYIGQTKRSLSTRLKEHRNNIKKKKKTVLTTLY